MRADISEEPCDEFVCDDPAAIGQLVVSLSPGYDENECSVCGWSRQWHTEEVSK